MNLSFTTMGTPELGVAELATVVQKYGFDAVDLRMIEKGSGEIPMDASESQLHEIKALAGKVNSIFCYNKRIETGVAQMADSICQHMDIAKAMSVPKIRIFTGEIQPGMEKDVCQAVEQAFEKGPDGVEIVIQNHLHISATIEQAISICKAVNTERLGIALSPDHALLMNEPIPLEEALPYVKQLYVVGDEIQNRGIPTEPLLSGYRNIIDALKAREFDGCLTFKWERCWKQHLAGYETVFPDFVHWMQELDHNIAGV